jgi:hypothetical protein
MSVKPGDLCRVLIDAVVFNYRSGGEPYTVVKGPTVVIAVSPAEREYTWTSPALAPPAMWFVLTNNGLGYVWEHRLDIRPIRRERT